MISRGLFVLLVLVRIEGRRQSEVENFIEFEKFKVSTSFVTGTGNSSGKSSSNTIIVSEEARKPKLSQLLLDVMGRRPY